MIDKSKLDFANYKRHVRGYRSVNASDNDVKKLMGINVKTYSRWLSFQRKVRKVRGLEDIDHRYCRSKLDVNDYQHRLIAVNVVNLAPMNRSDNRSKGSKVVIELLQDQVMVAKKFLDLLRNERSSDRHKFKALLKQYKKFVDEVSLKLLADNDILI